MYKHELERVADWLQIEDVQFIIESSEEAALNIECSRCESLNDVRFIDFETNGSIWLCLDCLNDIRKNGLEEELKTEGKLSLRFQILERDSFKCVYCGRNPLEDGAKLEVDHVHPKSKGGTDDYSNLVTSCRECNIGKTDVLLSEFNKQKILDNR